MPDMTALRQLAAKSLHEETQSRIGAAQRAKDVAMQIKALAGHLGEWVYLLNQNSGQLASIEQRPTEIKMYGPQKTEAIESLDIDVTIGTKVLGIRVKDFGFGDDVVAEINGPIRQYELRLAEAWNVYRQRSDVPAGIYDLEGPAPFDLACFVELGTGLFEDSSWR